MLLDVWIPDWQCMHVIMNQIKDRRWWKV